MLPTGFGENLLLSIYHLSHKSLFLSKDAVFMPKTRPLSSLPTHSTLPLHLIQSNLAHSCPAQPYRVSGHPHPALLMLLHLTENQDPTTTLQTPTKDFQQHLP